MKLKKYLKSVLDDVILRKYQNADFVVLRKTKVLTIITLTASLVVLILYPLYFFYESSFLVMLPPTITLIACILILLIIRLGHYSIASHLLLITVLTAGWITLFIDNQHMIIKMDTIAFVIGGFVLITLADIRRKGVVMLYLLANLLTLVLFYKHITGDFALEPTVALEYAFDNAIVFCFLAVICYQVISINNDALEKAKESIKLAESETEKNRELAQTLEIKVNQRTEELKRNNSELQKEVEERLAAEAKLKEIQKQLLVAAHKAGMAEIATDSLHNIGNILNSVKTSAYVIAEEIDKSPMKAFSNTCDLIRNHQENLEAFVKSDPRGLKSIEYFLKLEENFKMTFQEAKDNIDRLNQKIDSISAVVAAQQNYATAVTFTETVNLIDVIEETLVIFNELKINKEISIIKKIEDISEVTLQKSKLQHVLINLFKNAAISLQNSDSNEKTLEIEVFEEDGFVSLVVSDNGEGIEKENLNKIFTHGFTTHEGGSGFGLHSCANSVAEMGGTITADSEGRGKGARFHMKLPVF